MIKNFIYLDIDKMYSLSSQIFEGISEYILAESSKQSEADEFQKGPTGSGRILGNIIKNIDTKTEKKFLNDYSYNLFEQKLIEDDRVLGVNGDSSLSDIQGSLIKKSFIKIKALTTIKDIKSLNDTLVHFNDIGKAITYVTNIEKITQAKEQLEKARSTTKDQNKKAKIESELKSFTNINKLTKESGLHQDQAFVENLSLLLGYGFQEQLEVQMRIAGGIVSANLKRECLREKEDLIIKKYSRQSEVEFVLFGIVTQFRRDELEIDETNTDFATLKEALMNMVLRLTKFELTFTGRLPNEIIVDPIAVYTEL